MVAKLSREAVLKQFKEVHGDSYDYSKFEYTNGHHRSVIICKIHGEYLQSAICHKNRKQGCPKCGRLSTTEKQRLNIDELIHKFKETHGNRYDYSKVDYVRNSTPVCIICPEHGEFWQQPNNHIQGKGCQKCARVLNTWSRSSYIEICKKRNKGLCNLYVLECQEQNGKIFYKIGITYQKLRYRFKASYIPYQYKVNYLIERDAGFIYDLEKELHKLLAEYKYIPESKFHGSAMECFSIMTNEVLLILDELTKN